MKMRVTTQKVVVIEMAAYDYTMLCDTLHEASKVRTRLFPSLNEKAAMLFGLLTSAEVPGFRGGQYSQMVKEEAYATDK